MEAKNYMFKVYSKRNIFKFLINPKNIISEVIFSSTINVGQGEMDIKINASINEDDYIQGDVIKVYIYNNTFYNGYLIYGGIISQIIRLADTNTQTITLKVIGYGMDMNFILYQFDSYLELLDVGSQNITDINSNNLLVAGGVGVYEKEINDEPRDIIQQIISYYNDRRGNVLRTDLNEFQTYGTNLNINFKYDSCLNCISKLLLKTNYRFYVDQQGKTYFKPNGNSSDFIIKFGIDINNLEILDDSENLINKLFIEYIDGVYTYTDNTSISTYGVKEKYLNNQEILNEATAIEFATNYINYYKEPKKITKIELNSNYNYEYLKPGDIIEIKNINYNIGLKQIKKIDYRAESCILWLDEINNLGKQFITNND